LPADCAEVSLALQALWLRRSFPDSTVSLTARRLTWAARVQPLQISRAYSLQLIADHARTPSIYVTDPPLRPDETGRLPHVYDDGSLCVAEPGDWKRHMLFVDTFVPWALEWLVYYELWRATGIWHGDGPDRTDRISQARVLHPYVPPKMPRTRRDNRPQRLQRAADD